MAKKILNESYVFSCSNAIVPAPFIQVKDPQSKAYDFTGQKILTSGAKCQMIVPPPLCLKNPNPAQPPVPPYLPCCLSQHSSWRNTNGTMTINGKETLCKDSTCTCNSKGGTISCQFPSPTSKIQTGAVVSGLSAIAAITAQVVSSSGDTGGKADYLSESNVTQSDSTAPVVDRKVEETSSEESTSEVEEEESVASREYMCCNYEKCKKTATCDYYNADLNVKNDAKKLRNNFTKEFLKEEKAYLDKEEAFQKQLSNNGFTNAAHHMISGNACFLAKGKDDMLRVGVLVRLAVFFGYDINNALNCILLPTYNKESVKTENEELRTSAFEIMAGMTAQWHSGGHSYSISSDTKKHIENYLTTNPQAVSTLTSDKIFINYSDVVIAQLEKLKNTKYKTKRCQLINKDEKAKEFSEQMNQISQEIKKKLDLFRDNPQKSYPYYVSKTAVSYAFDVPRTLKLMVIRQNAHGKFGTIYRIQRLVKNDRAIEVKAVGTHPVESTSSFIKFCANITCFLDLQGQALELGFYTSSLPNSKDVLVHPMSLTNPWDGKENIISYLKKNKQEVVAEMTKHETAYQGTVTLQSIRLKALKKGE